MTRYPQTTHATETSPARTLRLTAAGLVFGLVAVAGLVGARLYERLQPVPAEPVLPLAVETQVIQPSPFVHSIHTTGTVEAEHRVTISAQLAAPVLAVPFREGSRVTQGDILVQLDDAEPRREVARLEAASDRVATDLAFWRNQLEADRRLLASKSISRRAFDETERQVASLQATLRETQQALQQARIQLGYAVLRAPYDCYIQTVRVLPGDLVQFGTPMLELLAVAPLKIVASLPEADLVEVHQKQTVRAHIPAVGRTWTVALDRIYPRLERGTRSATIEIFLPTGSESVRPGMAADVDIIRSQTEDDLVIPHQALRDLHGETGVFVLVDGEARWRKVRVGAAQNGLAQILDGLRQGDELIVTPHPQLADARPVVARNDWRRSLQ